MLPYAVVTLLHIFITFEAHVVRTVEIKKMFIAELNNAYILWRFMDEDSLYKFRFLFSFAPGDDLRYWIQVRLNRHKWCQIFQTMTFERDAAEYVKNPRDILHSRNSERLSRSEYKMSCLFFVFSYRCQDSADVIVVSVICNWRSPQFVQAIVTVPTYKFILELTGCILKCPNYNRRAIFILITSTCLFIAKWPHNLATLKRIASKQI